MSTEKGSAENRLPSGVDRNQALENTRGKETLLKELARAFLEDAPAQLASVRQGVQKGDAAFASRSAHAMKSSLDLLAAARARDLALQIELAGKAGDLEMLPGLSEAFFSEMERVMSDLACIIRDV